MTKNEESLLTEWLVRISRRGIPVSKVNLLGSVQCIKKSDGRVSPEIIQEAQLPQRNSASAAHMEGAKPSSPVPLPPLATPMRMVESETPNKRTSSVPSTKRTLR